MNEQPQPWPGCDWLWTDDSDLDQLVVHVEGTVAAERADHMWEAFEWAAEHAVGRLIVFDLTRAASFDRTSLLAFTEIARAATRRRDDLRVVLGPHSTLGLYLRSYGLVNLA
jgi:hypothetical protein